MTMDFALVEMPLRSRRDVVWARQRVRRLTALLKFEGHEQALVVAGAFAIAYQALGLMADASLCVHVRDGALHILAQPTDGFDEASAPGLTSRLCLHKPLPHMDLNGSRVKLNENGRGSFSSEDISWIAAQIPLLEKLDVFEEIRRQNDEILALLHRLKLTEPVADNRAEPAENATAA